jgi:dolichyl-phosphate beta-glucosyltransferase
VSLDLSVVIPAYNEAARLPPTLVRVSEHLRGQGISFEIIVVDDGSTDGTAEVARREGGSVVTVVRVEPNRGKGHAVRTGMLRAGGALRLMTDADLSTPIEDLARLREPLESGSDVAIGSRAVAGANVEIHQPWFREAAGRTFNRLVQLLALPGLHDTQCGFKLWKAKAATEAFSRGLLDGFCFDVEALYIARKRGRRVVEVPVTWRNDVATRVGTIGGMAAFADLLRIRANDWAGRYDGAL